MAKHLTLSIVTPERVLFEGEVAYISLPGTAGSMGVLVDHAPLISSLKAGTFDVRPVHAAAFFFSTQRPGLFEVNDNKVAILLDALDSAVIPAP